MWEKYAVIVPHAVNCPQGRSTCIAFTPRVCATYSDVVHNATVVMYSRGKLKDKKVAEVVLQLSTLKPNTPLDKWCDMLSDGGTVGSGGSVRLKAVYSSDVLLPLKKYAKLSTQLSDPTLAYALVLADAMKGRVPELARNLVRIWVAGGIFRSLIHVLVSKDVAQETSCGTLFRGNSLGTKCIDQYMKETGLPFLHQAIGDPIRQLFEEKRSCELDPTRKGGKTDNMTVRGMCRRRCFAWFCVQHG